MNLVDQSFPIFRFLGITVSLHFVFPIYIFLQLLMASGRGEDLTWTLTFYTMLFGVVLVHEYGHCLGARSVGGDPRHIVLWPLGGLAYADAPRTPWAQFVTVACGPLVNVVFCVAAGVLLIALTGNPGAVPFHPYGTIYISPGSSFQYYLAVFYRVNLALLYFNLLPIYPFDGGQLLQIGLWRIMGYRRSLDLAARIGLGGAVLLGVWGLLESDMLLVTVALFGGFTSYQTLMAARYGWVEEDYRVIRQGPRRADRTGPSLWQRIRGSLLGGGGERRRPGKPQNPNPGGWEAKMEERERKEQELDRILKKVREHGLRSLTYVEQQFLERATRERQHDSDRLDVS